MNERIRELMVQTLDKEFSNTWTTLDYPDIEKFSDYFSKLLAQESISIVQSFRCKMDASNDNIVVAMKQHFEVK